ncbi:MAG: glycosyltransferase family 4 protein [Proteobacteria bacterium]|nr:glycosyltransferase family 4 protein [Pseudomonadota bacterium]
MKPYRILHIDTETTWRGGENQIRLFLEGTQTEAWQWHLAVPPHSEAQRRMSHLAQVLPLAMRGARIIRAAFSLAQYVREQGIMLIDCQSGRAHNLGLMVKRLCPHVKLLVHRRVDYPPAPGFTHRFKYKTAMVDRYICISSAITRVLSDFGIPEERLRTVHDGVDAQVFHQVNRTEARQRLFQEWGLNHETPIIGNLAYITEQKDHATLIRALAKLRDRGLSFFAFIAGDGHLRPAAERLAADLQLGADRLRFLGVRTDVPELLASTDIYALSSQDEGLGTSLLEAAHSGCALVTTDVGGIPEVVIHNKTGLSSKAHDAEGFANNLARLLLSQSELHDFRQAARAHVEQHFSLQAMIQGNLKVYQELLD